MPKIIKAVLRTFLEDMGATRVINARSIRKCGEKPRAADQTPVLDFRDLRFYWQKSGCARRVSDFPALPKINGEGDSLEQTNTQTPLNRLVHNVVKSLRPIRNKEKAGAACAK